MPMNLLRVFVCVCMAAGFVIAVLLFPSILYLTNLEEAFELFPVSFAIALLISVLLYRCIAPKNGTKKK